MVLSKCMYHRLGNFRRQPFPTKIKHAKYFVCMRVHYSYAYIHVIIHMHVLATKIRLRENFSEIFYRQKYPDLRYNYTAIRE